jgi:hypothetical protein
MFVVDDALLCPFKGFLWIAREIHNAAIQDSKNEAEAIREELSQLYRELEAGEITESEFDVHEQQLLDRLDLIESRSYSDNEGDSDEDGPMNEADVIDASFHAPG